MRGLVAGEQIIQVVANESEQFEVHPDWHWVDVPDDTKAGFDTYAGKEVVKQVDPVMPAPRVTIEQLQAKVDAVTGLLTKKEILTQKEVQDATEILIPLDGPPLVPSVP